MDEDPLFSSFNQETDDSQPVLQRLNFRHLGILAQYLGKIIRF